MNIVDIHLIGMGFGVLIISITRVITSNVLNFEIDNIIFIYIFKSNFFSYIYTIYFYKINIITNTVANSIRVFLNFKINLRFASNLI